jgi:hypothetical protein
MGQVALVELGSGCCHGADATKAAIRACNDAIEWNSVKVRTIIPGGYDAMKLHVQSEHAAPRALPWRRTPLHMPPAHLRTRLTVRNTAEQLLYHGRRTSISTK